MEGVGGVPDIVDGVAAYDDARRHGVLVGKDDGRKYEKTARK